MAVRSSKGERLGFFHSFGNWLMPLVDARCCRLGHTQVLPSADMEKGSGYMGQGGRQVSRGQSARPAWRKVAGWLWGYSCLLSSVASGGVAHWVPPCPLLVDGCKDLTNSGLRSREETGCAERLSLLV